MYGAILGDIIGSSYEFDSHNVDTKDFPLFTEDSHITDAGIMILAVADACLKQGFPQDPNEFRISVTQSMQKFGQAYPMAGYGMHFITWLYSDEPKPFDKDSNVGAVRTVSIPWLLDSELRRARAAAQSVSAITNSDVQGLRGADALASAIFLAMHGRTKDEIRKSLGTTFGISFDKTVEDLHREMEYTEVCRITVPAAIIAFLEGETYEECVRNAVYIGGNSDTIAAMTGAVAEAMYGVPGDLMARISDYLEDDLREVCDLFGNRMNDMKAAREKDAEKNKAYETALGEAGSELPANLNAVIPPAERAAQAKAQAQGALPKQVNMAPLEKAIADLNAINPKETPEIAQKQYNETLKILSSIMAQGGRLFVPAVQRKDADGEQNDPKKPKLQVQYAKTPDGKLWEPAFTTPQAMVASGNKPQAAVSTLIAQILLHYAEKAPDNIKAPKEVSGVLINPGTSSFVLTRPVIEVILRANAQAQQAAKNKGGAGRSTRNLIVAKGDITKLKVDAVVSPASGSLLGNACPIDRAIHQAAGAELLNACRRLHGCKTGEAKMTAGYNLPAKYVIHAVPPVYTGSVADGLMLASSYASALNLVKENDLHSVAFSDMAPASPGYPRESAAKTALSAINKWMRENPSYVINITLCLPDDLSYRVYQKLLPKPPKPVKPQA